jgi:hypothetical protein
MARTSWHPAFVQAIEQELEESLDVLSFESEHQLTAEPLKIDVLIIKKEKNVVIQKNIAKIFRSYNIVEYKSPADRATIEDYHKTQCYARLYASLNKVDINEMSVSVVATRHPRKLLAFLKKQYGVKHTQPGIYLVERDTCPTQIIVSEELSEKDNFWLGNLRNDLTGEQLERVFIVASERDKIDAYLYAIGDANAEKVEELYMRRKKGVILTEKLDACFGATYLAKGEAKGIAIGEARGEARGETRGKVEALLTVLRSRFSRVPKDVEKAIRQMSDPIALDSWTAHAATCQTLSEFAEALK